MSLPGRTISNIYPEVQVKKHFTPEEHAMRRAEMARRRKNLSEKRNEEEKVRIFHTRPDAFD
jgi:Ino eighty subunit 2